MSAEPGPCLVGLTGGLASGKSTVAELFRQKGIPVRDADRIVHELYAPEGEGAHRVRGLFGPSMLDASGGVDRRELAARIMGDREAKSALEETIHPLVRQEIASWAAEEDAPILLVEAALLIETGSAAAYDVLLAVVCGSSEQRRRAIARGMAPEQADAILDMQVSDAIRKQAADLIIDNSGTRQELPASVDAARQRLVELCREKREIC